VAGDLIDPDTTLADKARAGAKAGGFYARWLPKLVAGPGQLPTSYAEFGALAGHLRYVERNARKLARSTFYAMSRWQGRMELKQNFLARIVDIGAELFAMSAACVRAQHLATSSDHGPQARRLADTFCRQARIRVDELFARLWTNTDGPDRALTRSVLDGEVDWLEAGIVDPSREGPWIAEAEPGPSRRENVHRPVH
jgi:hypothetical protein